MTTNTTISELQTLKKGSHVYSDIPSNFAKSVISNDLSACYDLKAIQNSLSGIIMSVKGESPFYPEFGCNISNLLFENMNVVTAYSIKNAILEAVNKYEPRVEISNVTVDPIYDENQYNISIYYKLNTDYETLYKTNLILQGQNNNG